MIIVWWCVYDKCIMKETWSMADFRNCDIKILEYN